LELSGPAGATGSLTVRLDLARGSFTSASLAAAGFTGPVNSTYSRASSNLAAAQAALRQLIFAPVPNRVPVGQTEQTVFTVVLSNGSTSRTNTAASVTTTSINNAPVTSNDSGIGFVTTEIAAFTTANVLTNDSDIDPGDFALLTVAGFNTSGTFGSISNAGNGRFYYDPKTAFLRLPPGSSTNDVFHYTVTDGHGGYATGRVTITINGLNTAPTGMADTLSIFQDAPATDVTPQLLANDFDVDLGQNTGLYISAINTVGTRGVAQLTGSSVTYNPFGAFTNLADGVTATDSFSYTIRDAIGLTGTANVTVIIVGKNAAPLGVPDYLSLLVTNSFTNLTTILLANDTDADPGETATLTIVGIDTSATKGSVSLTNNILSYVPASEFASLPVGSNVIDTFTYRLQDIHGALGQANVTITNLGVNQAPAAFADYYEVVQGSSLSLNTSVLTNDIDPNFGETATLQITGVISNGLTGALAFTGGNITYTYPPQPTLAMNQTFEDSFRYTIRDVHGLTATGMVRVVVNSPGLAPSAWPDTVMVWISESGKYLTTTLLANDSTPNSGGFASLVITAVSTPGTLGTVTLANGAVTYSAKGHFPNLVPGQTVSDTFTYRVTDSAGASSVASVNVIVAGAPIVTSGNTLGAGQLRITGIPGTICTILASTNLINWSAIGTATETSPGVFQFNDPSVALHQKRYYLIQQ
jgi:VCBS repeat-containing protein